MPSLLQVQRNNTGTHLSGDSSHPFSEDPERLLDVLDAIASICVVDREVYFVSLAMDPNHATLYVSTNGKVPATVTAHLLGIRRGLEELKAVLEPGPLNNTIHTRSSNDDFKRGGQRSCENTKSSSHSCQLATLTISKLSL